MIREFHKDKDKLKLKLNLLYENIKPGVCSGCANCCSESVGASFVEAANIYVHLFENNLFSKELLEKLMNYYLEIYEIRNKCPFLDDNKRCLIYTQRPLNCRLYGHWSKKDYEANLIRLKNNSVTISDKLKQSGFLVSKEYLDFQIPYCSEFIGEAYTLKKRGELYDELIKIDSRFITSNDLDIEYSDKGIVEHLAGFLFNTKKIDILRMQNKLNTRLKKRLLKYARLLIPKRNNKIK